MSRVPDYYFAYIMNSEADKNCWKRGHTVRPYSRLREMEQEEGWIYKRVGKFTNKNSALTVERGLRGYGEVYSGNEYFKYDFSDRQDLYNRFESLCHDNGAISVDKTC
jgi:hypothetical protein